MRKLYLIPITHMSVDLDTLVSATDRGGYTVRGNGRDSLIVGGTKNGGTPDRKESGNSH